LTILDADRTQHRISLDGIDAPEKAQPFGTRSRESLAQMAAGNEVSAECSKIDRFDRPVR
jgi:endonuclease YncB( thermonuclease family)